MTKKNKFITRLLVLTLFSTFISCNDELYDIKNQHNGVDKNKISLNQFKNETNINQVESILSVTTKTSIASKTKSQLSDFVIDTIAIKKIVSQNQKTTYTFRIYPLFKKNNENEYYNLVYRKVDGNWVKTVFLLNKKITQNKEEIRFETIEKISLDEKVTFKNQKAAQLCYQYYYEIRCNGSCDGPCDGFACPTGECLSLSVSVGSCGGGGGGSGTTSPINTGSPGYGGGGGSNEGLIYEFVFSPNTFANLNLDDPNFINEWQKSNVWANLSGPMKAYFTATPQRMDIFNQIIQYQIENNWSNDSQNFGQELLGLTFEEYNTQDANSLVNLSILINNNSSKIFEDDFITSLDPYVDLDLTIVPPDFGNLFGVKLYLNYRKIRMLNPEWSKGKCIWYASRDLIHLSLDAFGLIPVGGEIADLANGALYTIEGDGLNATLSFASAVPVAGWASVSTKYAIKVIDASQTATTIATKVKLTWKVIGNTVEFGNRGQLRKVLGITASNIQAHHLIPWSSQTKMAVQKAAKYGSAFHMNEELNGIAVAAWRNQPNHTTYNNIINGKLDAFRDDFPNATPQQCYTFLTNLINDIKTWVVNNPNSHLNDIVLP